MHATVTISTNGRPDNEALPRMLPVGAVISGDLATVAVRDGWAEEIRDEPAEAMDPDLARLKVDELKALAADRGIDLGDARTKAQIIALLASSAAG
ncbi:MAG: hypothetical protein ACK4U0_19235 [Mesorhizobium sp.]